jgi:glycosyltransferase involved in cell wall biosynthesis
MRVSFVSLETVHHRETEATRRLDDLATRLAARGHDVTVHTSGFWDGFAETTEVDGVAYRAVVPETEAWQSFYVRLPFSLLQASPDVVHARATPPGQAMWANYGTSVVRAPLVVEWYGDEASSPGKNHRRALGGADAVVTPSRLVRTRAWELGASEDHVDVVPNSVDMDRIRDVDPRENGEIVYARRLDAGANLESVLLGLAELRQREWSATVVGDGPERESYEQQARDLRIDDRVEFVGECSRDERIGIYRGAHVFCQTATHCVFPTELLWGMACGCVGIVEYHADSSAHELVEHRDRGFRTTSEEELATAIHEAGELEDLTVDEDFASFDRDPVMEEYLECYRAVRADYGIL